MKEKIKAELKREFTIAPFYELIDEILDDVMEKHYDELLKSEDYEDMNKELYIITRLKCYIYLGITNCIKEESIDAEAYLNDKLRGVYYLFLRKKRLDVDEKKYDKAIQIVANEYDGNSAISSCLYKALTEVYSEDLSKKKIFKKLF